MAWESVSGTSRPVVASFSPGRAGANKTYSACTSKIQPFCEWQMGCRCNTAEVICNEQHPSRKARCWRVRACYIQEIVAANIIRIEHMSGKQIPADCATKHAIPHLRTIARRVCAIDRIIPDGNGDTITNVSGMQGKGESDEPITSPT